MEVSVGRKTKCCVALIDPDGSVRVITDSRISVARLSVGTYEVTHNLGSDIVAIPKSEHNFDGSGYEDVMAHIDNDSRTTASFLVHTRDQDNGAADGALVDSAWTLTIPCCVFMEGCDTFADLTVTRPTDTPNTGWNNELIISPPKAGRVKLCFTIDAATGATPQMIGLQDVDTNDSYTDLDFAFYVYTNGTTNILQIRQSGAFVMNVPGAWSVGDELCIEAGGGQPAEYFVNGNSVATGATTNADLGIGSSFYYANGFWSSGSITLGNIELC